MGRDDDGKVFMGTFCLSADFTGWGDGFDGGLWGEITLIALILDRDEDEDDLQPELTKDEEGGKQNCTYFSWEPKDQGIVKTTFFSSSSPIVVW